MSLREKVSKLFAPQKQTPRPERPRDAWKSARATPEQRKAAEVERETQLRAFDEKKAASWNDDLAKERQKAALQHQTLKLTPPRTSELQNKMLIEKRATQALERKNQLERREIEQKPVHRLLDDAQTREARENAAEKARGDDRSKGSETPAPDKSSQGIVSRDDVSPDRHEPAEMQERPMPLGKLEEVALEPGNDEADDHLSEDVKDDGLSATHQDQGMPQATGWASPEERDSAIAAERKAREERDAGYDLDPGLEMEF